MTKNNKQQSAVRRTMALFRIPHSASRTSERGFTLIELAIVLVIIGIILGAVLKGQDLIEGARIKRLTYGGVYNPNTLIWSYYDKANKYPGDGLLNGKIGSTGGAARNDLIAAKLAVPETNTISLGSSVFYFYLGNEGTRNVIFICADSACGAITDTDTLTKLKGVDLIIDAPANGAANGTAGTVRTISDAVTTTPATWTATTAAATYVDFTTATKALIYYFDKQP